MRLRSLRARLLTGVMALAAVCLVIFAAITYVQQRDFLLERVDDQVRGAGPAVERALGLKRLGFKAGPFDGHGRGDGPPPTTLSLPPGVYGELRDADGNRLNAVVLTTGEAAPSPPDLPDDLPFGKLVTVDAVGDGGLQYRVGAEPRGAGTIVIAVPLTGVDEQLDELLVVEGLLIALVLLVMAGVGFWVVRVGMRPLDRIGETAGRIASGDLSQRVEPADDDTEVGRLGASLNAMLGQIEAAFAERTASEERLRRFLADASHELRTPLSSIRGYAELHRMGALNDDELTPEQAMQRIEQEAARMGVLVEDLLVLARLDEVREQVREPVDVAELARDAVADARAMAPERDVALHAGEDAVVQADGNQLRQVLGNLLRNALVHTPAGTPVEVEVVRTDGHVRVTVRDHGNGLPVDEGDMLFERFWRADPARGRGPAGAGLGLAIVHGIVTAHGGTVRAENAAGGGALFTVELPATGV